jgi:glycosyltransferase involved in cell wall biosynthesis
MRKILFVVPSLEPGGAAKQLMLLATGLPRDRFDGRVCVLGRSGLFAQPLHKAGLAVNALGWSRGFDLFQLLALRRLVQGFDPDVIHVWGGWALRAVRCAAVRKRRNGTPPRQVVVSAPLPLWQPKTRVGRLHRWLLRQADRVVVHGPSEAALCRRLSLSEERMVVVPPAVPSPDTAPAELADLRRSLGLPPSCHLLVCAGPLERHKGFLEALWAVNILKFVYSDLHLVVIGAGPDGERLQAMARRENPDSIHFLGRQGDVPALLAQADIVMVPSLAEGGVNVALEAMAAGKPVVASQLPGLAEIVVNGQTGFLVPPGDKVGLARRTRLLLDDHDRRLQLGESGRARVRDHFAVPALCRHFTRVYESMSNGPASVLSIAGPGALVG